MTRIITGTASVDPGGSIVTAWLNIDGVTLSEITAPAGSTVVIEGRANFIKTRLNTTSFELMLPHAGDGGAGLDCAVSALTAGESQIGTLNARTATVIQQLGVLDANGRGLFYNLIGATGDNDPGPGRMAFNNADPELVTEFYLDVLDANEGGRDVSGLLGLWTAGTVIIVRSLASTAYAAFQLSAPPAVPAGYRRASVSHVGGDGTLAQEPVGVEWLLPGADKDVDARVADLPGRGAFDGAPEGFRLLVENAGDGIAVRYTKLSAAAGHWSPGARYTGPIGATGPFTQITFGPTTTLSAGSAATATVVEVDADTIRIDLGLPRGLDGTGTGDVVGPAGSVSDRIAVFDGETGKLLKDGGKTIAELTPANGSVTNAKLADMAQATIKGRAAGAGNGAPTDLTPAQVLALIGAFHKGNILGAVSQASGVPTGAIIERGSNANGDYVRFADGTQFAWGLSSRTNEPINAAMAGGYRSTGIFVTVPVSFTTGYVLLTPGGALTTTGAALSTGLSGTSFGYVALATALNPGANFSTYWLAVGRWF